MKATELKLGDWVSYKEPVTGKKKVRITAIYSQRLVCLSCDRTTLFDLLSPIPLTKEILENNGFEEGGSVGDYTVSYRKDELFLEYDWSEDKIYFQDFYRSVGSVELQYVHQLQHLLWALGEDDNLKI